MDAFKYIQQLDLSNEDVTLARGYPKVDNFKLPLSRQFGYKLGIRILGDV
jgi:hypothetical protein